MLPKVPKIPTPPFEMIYADFFELASKHYSIFGGCMSGWTGVVNAEQGSSYFGYKGFCEPLRNVFMIFRVTEEISSDGGPGFVSGKAEDFYYRWGITHSLSSSTINWKS